MSPSLVLYFWLGLLAVLLYWDPAKTRNTSHSLWIPVLWLLIMDSRLPSQWLGLQTAARPVALEEGNGTDRLIYTLLILSAFSVLASRSIKWRKLFSTNLALTAFICYTLISVCWSDFSFISLKRWFRDLGDYLMILVMLADRDPIDAICIVLRRVYYVLLPLSIVLIKYYPQVGKQYDEWTGYNLYVGATMSKNMLGSLCLFAGLFFLWDIVMRWAERKKRTTQWSIAVNLVFLGQTLWLLNLASSATSEVCLALGCCVIAIAYGTRYRHTLKWAIPGCLCVYLIAVFGLGMNGLLVAAVGRDPTFTGRTNIWNAVLSTHTNWLLGTGYQSFWLGSRLTAVWALAGAVNETHNGYLDIYVNLGLVGLVLLGAMVLSSYRRICRLLDTRSPLAGFTAALWMVALFYNMTEAAFTPGFMCITFLLGTVRVPMRTMGRAASSNASSLEVIEAANGATVECHS